MENKTGLYIHIPFCERKCRYCGFLSFEGCGRDLMDKYINALCLEIASSAPSGDAVTDTVFIGGGTPSLLGIDDIKKIMSAVRENYRLSDDAEITCESNPGSLTAGKLAAMRDSGINRISIGVQSFDDAVLGTPGRIHDGEEALRAFGLARSAGFDNINLDLMFGIPGQTDAQWDETLGTATGLAPEHISFYSLQLEPGTPFYEAYKNEEMELSDDKTERGMYHRAVRALRDAGYVHYEISNASLPGRQCRHNFKYWNYGDYIGAGLGASSFHDGRRYKNVDDINIYVNLLDSGRSPVSGSAEPADAGDEYGIFCFTALRTSSGISLARFKDTFGLSLYRAYPSCFAALAKYIGGGYIDASGGSISLTEKGIDISNEIMAEFV